MGRDGHVMRPSVDHRSPEAPGERERERERDLQDRKRGESASVIWIAGAQLLASDYLLPPFGSGSPSRHAVRRARKTPIALGATRASVFPDQTGVCLACSALQNGSCVPDRLEGHGSSVAAEEPRHGTIEIKSLQNMQVTAR